MSSCLQERALIELRDVVKHFPVSRSLGEIVRGRHPAVHALDGVSLDIGAGDAIAIVGESGCGKTTLGRLMLKLTEPTAGTIAFDGAALGGLRGESLRAFRRQAQLVFQNPFDALNPRFTIYRAVAEPLLNAGIDKAEHADRVAQAFRRVHLPDLERYLDRYPHQLSGGQLQRVVLARALVLDAALPGRRRAGVDARCQRARRHPRPAARGARRDGPDRRLYQPRPRAGPLSLRAHGGDVSRHRGRGRPDRRDRPQPAPSLHPRPGRRRAGARRRPVRAPLPISGNVPDAREPPSGCRFRDRCPHAFARCAEETPALRATADGHRVACHLDG